MADKRRCEDVNELKRQTSVDDPKFAFYKSVDLFDRLSNWHHSTALRQTECGNHFGFYPVDNATIEVSHMLKCVDMRYPATAASEQTELLHILTPQ